MQTKPDLQTGLHCSTTSLPTLQQPFQRQVHLLITHGNHIQGEAGKTNHGTGEALIVFQQGAALAVRFQDEAAFAMEYPANATAPLVTNSLSTMSGPKHRLDYGKTLANP